MTKKPLTRWPPYKGYDGPGLEMQCAPNRCYCGKHPGYEPLPPLMAPTHAPKADKRQAETWKNRDGQTWIDRD